MKGFAVAASAIFAIWASIIIGAWAMKEAIMPSLKSAGLPTPYSDVAMWAIAAALAVAIFAILWRLIRLSFWRAVGAS